MEADAFTTRVPSSLYADDSMFMDQFTMSDNTRQVPTVVKHAEATSDSDDVQDNMSVGSLDCPDLDPVFYDSPNRSHWSTYEYEQVDYMADDSVSFPSASSTVILGDPSVSSSSRQQEQQHHLPSTSTSSSSNPTKYSSPSPTRPPTSTSTKRRANSISEKDPKTSNKKGKHTMEQDDVMDGNLYEVEDIVGHKVYRSQAVMYEIKWKGYDSRQNTWETASHIHEDCPRLCIDYWNRQENIPIPKNVPRQHQQRPSSSSSQTIQSYIQRLQKYNIDNNSLVPYYRKQGYRLSYDLDYPTAETDWKKELRVIHFVQRVKSTDQILAYVSWMNKKKTVHVIQELHEKCPDMLISYYESCLTFAGP